jgi:hypothetical protein
VLVEGGGGRGRRKENKKEDREEGGGGGGRRDRKTCSLLFPGLPWSFRRSQPSANQESTLMDPRGLAP